MGEFGYNEYDEYMDSNIMEGQEDSLGRVENDLPLDSYGFPCVYKDNGKLDKTLSVSYKCVPMGFEYNEEWLRALRFNDNEIITFNEVLFLIGYLTEKRLRSRINLYNNCNYYTQGDIELLMYMYKCCLKGSSQSLLSDIEFMTKHLNKLYNLRNAENPNAIRGNVSQLTKYAFSKIPKKFERFPRRVEINGIDDETFGIYNSSNYVKYDKLYSLADGTNVGSEYVTIITDKVPKFAFRAKKELEDVCSLVSVAERDETVRKSDALYELKINREYIKFRPTYYVYLTTKLEPGVQVDGYTYTLNHYQILGESGIIMSVAIGVHLLGKHERNKIPASETVLAVGYYPDEILTKLKGITKELYVNPYINGINIISKKGNCTLNEFINYNRNLTVEERELELLEMEQL